jgi:hypothetical protein
LEGCCSTIELHPHARRRRESQKPEMHRLAKPLLANPAEG